VDRKLRTDAGYELDAKASLTKSGSRFELTFQSSGESGRRNRDYAAAFELGLKRIAALGAILQDARVESRVTKDWPAEDKRIHAKHAEYPLDLVRIADVGALATNLRTGRSQGWYLGKRRQSDRRITLEFPLPTTSAADVVSVANALFGGPELAAGDERFHAWWITRPEERYWLEITGRSDLGVDLRAPVSNEQGEHFWSYGLLRYVRQGDLVFHYRRSDCAIVALSRATGTQWPDAIVWAARGTSARDAGIVTHIRDGRYVGLEQFQPLQKPERCLGRSPRSQPGGTASRAREPARQRERGA